MQLLGRVISLILSKDFKHIILRKLCKINMSKVSADFLKTDLTELFTKSKNF